MLVGVAGAAVIVDGDGIGFVGKGDVQLAFGWNNAQLQAQAATLQFRLSAAEEVSWVCDRDAGPQTPDQDRTSSLDASIANDGRVKKQITGFNLDGFAGDPVESVEGPAYGSCPSNWTHLDEVMPGETTLEVSADGGATWVVLPPEV